MMRHTSGAGVLDMTERDSEIVMLATERFERRLAEETGKLRVEMTHGFGQMRAEMSDRNADLLKWLLVFFAAQTATQTAALAALLSVFK
jgi:hypothetical protein